MFQGSLLVLVVQESLQWSQIGYIRVQTHDSVAIKQSRHSFNLHCHYVSSPEQPFLELQLGWSHPDCTSDVEIDWGIQTQVVEEQIGAVLSAVGDHNLHLSTVAVRCAGHVTTQNVWLHWPVVV